LWDPRGPLLQMKAETAEKAAGGGSVFFIDPENYPLPGSAATGDTGVGGEVVFAGYGIDAPEYSYNDYRDLDVEGKIVLVFRYEPNEKDPDSVFDGSSHSKYATFLYKMQTAKRKGAAGLILFDNPLHHPEPGPYAPPPGIAGSGPSLPRESGGIPGVHVSAERIIGLYPSVDFTAIQKKIDAGGAVPELPYAEGTIRIVPAAETTDITGRNVAGYIPSRGNRRGDITREEKLIVIGAHHDHLGSLGDGAEGDRIFNGADDNASGVAAVLELAEHFFRRRQPAGLVFVTFSAEELGLYGSKAFLDELPLVKEKTVMMINFDMIGRNPGEEVVVQYSGPASFEDLVRERLPAGYDAVRQRSGMQGYISDSYVFSESGVPSLFFFTGTHEDYHMPSDEADLLDYVRMEEIAETAAGLVEIFSEVL
jgi:aminopeptidase YwaD